MFKLFILYFKELEVVCFPFSVKDRVNVRVFQKVLRRDER